MLLRRPVASQPAPPDGAAPLPVGIVPFCGPEPRLAVIVKVTCTLRENQDGSRTFVRSDKQEPLTLPIQSTLVGASSEELAYPGDFVPRKTAIDVLVTGHAHALHPTGQIQAEFHVGSVIRTFSAATSGAATMLPLTAPYLRGPDGFSPTESIAARTVPALLDEHPADFDYSVYNAAPAVQRATDLPQNGKMFLRGLVPGAEYIEAILPAIMLHAVLVSAHDNRIDVPLRNDTIWIDSDQSIAMFVFRGDVQLIPPDVFDLRQIIVWADEPRGRQTVDDVRRDLPRGVFGFAVAAEDLAGGGPPGDPAEVDLVRYSTFDASPAPTLTLEQYATISAELAEGKPKRDEVLRRHRLDEDAWLLEERAIVGNMAEAAVKQDTVMAERYGELFMVAQDALAEPWEKDQTLDDYVDLKAEMEVKSDPHRVLGERQMRFAPWMRIDRRFTRQALADPAFAKLLEERLAAAMRRFSAEPDEPIVDEEIDL
jgi:Uncharacterized protein conserved in bacteria (DUF2169)